MFRLTEQEKQEVVANCDHLSRLKYSKYLPYAFTEHGAIMAATVLNTSRAVGVSIYVVRAFIKLREILSEHKELALKLAELDKKVAVHDVSIKNLVETMRRLASPSGKKKRRRVGFDSDLSLNNKRIKSSAFFALLLLKKQFTGIKSLDWNNFLCHKKNWPGTFSACPSV